MSVRVLTGDVREKLREMPGDSIDCVVTSPPYWGLRDYGVDGQIGMERTLGEHIETLVSVFSEMRRVMKPKAAFWLNYGDCYATTPNGRSAADTKAAGNDDRTFRDKPFSTIQGALKPKDLCLVPFRLVIALQEDGWWVRSRCVWGKPNGMPDSSGRYRPSVAHEEIFLLSKSGDLWYDFEAVKTPSITGDMRRPYAPGQVDKRGNGHDRGGGTLRKSATTPRNDGSRWNENNGRGFLTKADKQRGHSRRHQGFNDRWDQMTKEEQQENGRLLRTYEPEVWHIATAAFGDAHFATFPPALVERCLMASCPEGGVVLDPFGGSGTVGLVADRMKRSAILIDLNPAYADMARKRIADDAGMFGDVA